MLRKSSVLLILIVISCLGGQFAVGAEPLPAASQWIPKNSVLAVELADPKSPVSEGYNSLRGSLLYSTSHGLPKSMLVTTAQSASNTFTASKRPPKPTSNIITSTFSRMKISTAAKVLNSK